MRMRRISGSVVLCSNYKHVEKMKYTTKPLPIYATKQSNDIFNTLNEKKDVFDKNKCKHDFKNTSHNQTFTLLFVDDCKGTVMYTMA